MVGPSQGQEEGPILPEPLRRHRGEVDYGNRCAGTDGAVRSPILPVRCPVFDLKTRTMPVPYNQYTAHFLKRGVMRHIIKYVPEDRYDPRQLSYLLKHETVCELAKVTFRYCGEEAACALARRIGTQKLTEWL